MTVSVDDLKKYITLALGMANALNNVFPNRVDQTLVDALTKLQGDDILLGLVSAALKYI